ncbi:DMT family transporter [Aerobium aerolatum]|uniref:Permease of the drug/metabolite transporter (DMT) superfamily n=1 Tax=Aquamicrobium aerolatum DSM 21857 TaxID=1121003 RepID=A0A1I3MDQ0_9HYPH|nr:DMT family transporter [Aquamicrobium aerolatum]SFI95062.1 Permease of the drug/metabolite transporter (DMT) superfamily [Aquamicrobium aerolatum DSM 21857]
MKTSIQQKTITPRDWSMLLLLGALWGGSFFFARVAVLEIHPLTLVLFRVSIAAVALHIYLALVGPSFRLALPMAASFFGLAALNNVIPFTLMFAGQTELGAGAASILNATTPFWTMLLANMMTDDEKLSWNKIIGVVLGICGAVVMIGPDVVTASGAPVWAKFALVGTAVSYAFAALYARRFSKLAPQIVATGQLTASTLIMLPVVLLWNGTSGLFDASMAAWLSVLGLALLATSVGYILFFALIRSAGATNASLVTLIVPVSAILLGALFLGERMQWYEFGGMGLIGLGLIIIDGRLIRRTRT